jgi:hypothetical protein
MSTGGHKLFYANFEESAASHRWWWNAYGHLAVRTCPTACVLDLRGHGTRRKPPQVIKQCQTASINLVQMVCGILKLPKGRSCHCDPSLKSRLSSSRPSNATNPSLLIKFPLVVFPTTWHRTLKANSIVSSYSTSITHNFRANSTLPSFINLRVD